MNGEKPPERASIAQRLGALVVLGVAGCMGDARPEPVDEGVTATESAALQAYPGDAQTPCQDRFVYALQCYANIASPICPPTGTTPCASSYSLELEPSCTLAGREPRERTATATGHYDSWRQVCDDFGTCWYEPSNPKLDITCRQIANAEIARLRPEDAGAVYATVEQGPMQADGTDVWADCTITYDNWPVYAKPGLGTCRHVTHPPAQPSECAPELRYSAKGATLAQAQQEAQSAWEALGGVGIAPFAVAPICTSDTSVLPTDRQNGETPGVIGGAASVSADGAAQYAMSLWVPEGRAGLKPEIGLSYGSRGGNGILGVGFGLSGLSQITRCPKTVAQDGAADDIHFDASDRFCLDGLRLVAVNGAYGAEGTEYRSENDTFTKIVSSGVTELGPTTFRAYLKDGRILTFGGAAEGAYIEGARVVVSRGAEGPVESSLWGRYAWDLARTEDRSGNYVHYFYEGSVDDHHLRRIEWTGHAGSGLWPTRVAWFSYADRPDVEESYVAGLPLRTTKRLTRVEMWGPNPSQPGLLRSYDFTYANTSISRRSQLTEVKECDGTNACKRPTKFEWSQGSWSFSASTGPIYLNPYLDSNNRWVVVQDLSAGDFDGDGQDELLVHQSNGNWFWFKPQPYPVVEGGRWKDANPAISDQPPRFIDLDADGKLDFFKLAVPPGGGDQDKRWLRFDMSQAQAGWDGVTSDDQQYSTWKPHDLPPYFADLDGDGLPELMRVRGVISGDEIWGYRPNTKGILGDYINQPDMIAAWLDDPFAPNHESRRGLGQAYAVRVDGTSRTALLLPEYGNGSMDQKHHLTAWMLSGSSRVLQPTTLEAFVPNQGIPRYWFADVNGDGLADAVRVSPSGGEPTVYINSGNGYRVGFTTPVPPQYQSGSFSGWYNGARPGIYTADFDFDGKQDLVLSQKSGPGGERSTWQVLRSTGHGFEGQPLSVPLGDFDLDPVTHQNNARFASLADVNGDGMTDIIQSETDQFGNVRVRMYKRQGPPPDLLQAVVDGNAARSEFSYGVVTPSTTSPKPALPQTGLSSPLRVVRKLSLDNGQGVNHYEHSYAGGRADLLRGFLGFRSHTVTHLQTGATTYTEYDVSTRAGNAYPLAGKPVYQRSEVTLAVDSTHPSGGWTHISEVATHYEVTQEANGQVYFAWPQSIQSVAVQLPPGQLPPAGSSWLPGKPPPAVSGAYVLAGADVTQSYDAYGNRTYQLAKRMYGGQYTGEQVEVTTSYFPADTTNWLIALPDARSTTHRLPGLPAETRTVGYEYYPGTGLLKAEVTNPDDTPTRVRTEYQRNAFGLPESVIVSDANGHSRADTIGYDGLEHMFPTTRTNALGHPTLTEYHPGLGVAVAVTSPNGVRVESQYDGFGRVRVVDNPDDADTATYYDWDSAGLTRVLVENADGRSAIMLFDKLGRQVERRTRGFDGGWVLERQEYDALGRRVKASAPHTDGEADQWTSFTYDKLGRVLAETRPDNTTIWTTYFPEHIETIDAKGAVSYVRHDNAGRVEESAEGAYGSAGLRTRFSYGPFGVTRQVQVLEGNQVRLTSAMAYDRLGRRTHLAEYYNGSATVGYQEQTLYGDPLGLQVQTIDAKGQAVTSHHDVLGRLVLQEAPEGDSIYTWDTPDVGPGRLASFINYVEDVRVYYHYDALGRLDRSSWHVRNPFNPGNPDLYEVTRQYDTMGRLAGIDYPAAANQARLHVSYGYNLFGHLAEVTDGNGHLLWRAEGVNARGQLTDERFGNGVTSHRVYDPVRHVLRRIDTRNSANEAVQALEVDFDANGNLTLRKDYLSQVHEGFGYDASNRLTGWSVQAPSGSSQHLFHYDGLGRLVQREVVEGDTGKALTLGYDDSGAHSPYAPQTALFGNASTPDSYAYDANGDQIEAPRRWVTFTSFNLPRHVSTWTHSANYFYGPDHQRVLKTSSSGEVTAYIEGLYERRYRTDQAEHVFHVQAGGHTVAQVTWKEQGGNVTSEEVGYQHGDHLGSPETITDAAGAVMEHLRFDPFGARADASNPVLPAGALASGELRRGFTGHEMEDEIGLINMKGRVYDPANGHFLSRDVVVQSPLDPRSYNRYAYVGYNPLSVTDPTGFVGEPTIGLTASLGGGGSSSSTGISFGLAPGSGYSNKRAGADDNQGGNEALPQAPTTPPPGLGSMAPPAWYEENPEAKEGFRALHRYLRQFELKWGVYEPALSYACGDGEGFTCERMALSVRRLRLGIDTPIRPLFYRYLWERLGTHLAFATMFVGNPGPGVMLAEGRTTVAVSGAELGATTTSVRAGVAETEAAAAATPALGGMEAAVAETSSGLRDALITNMNRAAKSLDVDRNAFRGAIHDIKQKAGMRGNHDVGIHPKTGDVYNLTPREPEHVGNIFDVIDFF